MKPPDPHLRALVAALRKYNGSQSPDDRARVIALQRAYKPARAALDTDEAIKELRALGTTERPKEVSLELRHAIADFLEGKIERKCGRKHWPSSTYAEWEAEDIRYEHEATGVPISELVRRRVAITNVNGGQRLPVTKNQLDAALYPRARKRKT